MHSLVVIAAIGTVLAGTISVADARTREQTGLVFAGPTAPQTVRAQLHWQPTLRTVALAAEYAKLRDSALRAANRDPDETLRSHNDQ